ncbi:MAG: DUF5916 domain-containing protein [bacterium]
MLLIPLENIYAHEKMEYVAEAVEIDPSEAPKIDGKFDDAVWKKGKVFTGFVQRDPLPGEAATEKSEVYILYDRENLYVGCRFYDSHPGNIIRELRRREEIETSDRIELFFDTFHNHRTGYKFSMNPYGVQMDEQRYDDDQRNSSWDGIWESGADIDSLGWVAEFKIPFFNMRFPDKEEQVWGFNLQREIRYKAERINWKPVSFDDRATSIRMSRLGHLVDIRGIRPGRRFEVRPYGLSGMSETDVVSAKGKNEMGFDLKYGVTSDITMDMTVNPDFAQVEADVLEVNLTRYPTRFAEKRDFFLEGKGIFETPPSELYYSRRIGGKGDILWGTKLSGITKGGLEFGLMGSQTGDWNYFGFGNKDSGKEDALFGTARIRKGFSNGSSIGAMFTNKETDNIYSRVFGMDGLFLYKGIYITNFQVSSSRNPDLLSENNSYYFLFNRRANPWSVRVMLERVEPNYDINQTGFMAKERYRGFQKIRSWLIYSPLVEKKGIRQVFFTNAGEFGDDIFTKNYINSWKSIYPDTPVEQRYVNGKLRPGNWSFDQSCSIRTTSEMNIGFWYVISKINELTETYRANRKGFNISSPKTGRIQKVSGNTSFDWGTFYNFAQKYVGSDWNVRLESTSWIRSNMGLGLDGQFTKTFAPGGVMDGRHLRISMRNTYLFTKDFFIRLYTQGRWGTTYYGEKSVTNNYLMSFLLGWEFHPGSWFYLAYNEDRADGFYFQQRDFMLTDRVIVAKIYYTIHK